MIREHCTDDSRVANDHYYFISGYA